VGHRTRAFLLTTFALSVPFWLAGALTDATLIGDLPAAMIASRRTTTSLRNEA
jgi:hypothetical protein